MFIEARVKEDTSRGYAGMAKILVKQIHLHVIGLKKLLGFICNPRIAIHTDV